VCGGGKIGGRSVSFLFSALPNSEVKIAGTLRNRNDPDPHRSSR